MLTDLHLQPPPAEVVEELRQTQVVPALRVPLELLLLQSRVPIVSDSPVLNTESDGTGRLRHCRVK